MKKIVLLFVSILSLNSFSQEKDNKLHQKIEIILDNWHKAAAEANFDYYFNVMHEESIFIGTDATENWNKQEFIAFAKPYFDKGKAWSFTSIERNIYFSKDKKTAWFDELLNTQMKICRGSGILVLEKGIWKIKHYVLSMTVPNDNVDEVVKIKAPIEDAFMIQLKENN
ncbi:MAG: nuclear transport factor 2 family protein [Flavobacterium sp.]|jgi:hypothetical protein